MAAPTPVSSLVHSSTLVTAGVYLIFRSKRNELLNIVGVFGIITAIFAALSAIREYDSKKLVALSTLSKLGIMVFSFSSGVFFQRFFHLITHAVAKANLFISVG
jgi:NADH:ubiquinone oxidoreductase subunit 5 (subunit L)/multisubunit Na+/H+ antiporter MnhA subunit